MRLINVHTMRIREIIGDDVPQYYILSHTWGEEEISYQDFVDHPKKAAGMRGFDKIRHICEIAKRSHVDYAWVDTCCIDKTSSAELSEAINSMYRWYGLSARCIVFLEDLEKDLSKDGLNGPRDKSADDRLLNALSGCRWFTRGWCLQELVAPTLVDFYNAKWRCFGSRNNLAPILQHITSIDEDALAGRESPFDFCVARRLSWAACRQTTRPEDMAYSLLGILEVNLPLLYGEGGERAFVRLQEEIVRSSSDWSIFAWKTSYEDYARMDEALIEKHLRGLFAWSPAGFKDAPRIYPLNDYGFGNDVSLTSRGVRISNALLLSKTPDDYKPRLSVSRNNSDPYAGCHILHLGHARVKASQPFSTPFGIYVRQILPQLFIRVWPDKIVTEYKSDPTARSVSSVEHLLGNSLMEKDWFKFTCYIPIRVDSRFSSEVSRAFYRTVYLDLVDDEDWNINLGDEIFPSERWISRRLAFNTQGLSYFAGYLDMSIAKLFTHLPFTLAFGIENELSWCCLVHTGPAANSIRSSLRGGKFNWITSEGGGTRTLFPYRRHILWFPEHNLSVSATISFTRSDLAIDKGHSSFRIEVKSKVCISDPRPLTLEAFVQNSAEGIVDMDQPRWQERANRILTWNGAMGGARSTIQQVLSDQDVSVLQSSDLL